MTRVLYVGCGFCSAKSLTADLPEYLRNHADVDIDVMVPHLNGIDEGVGKLAERLIDCSASIGGSSVQVKVLEGRRENHLRAFYMDADCLRSPLNLSSDEGVFACAVFAKAVCSWIKQVPTAYDIVHCEGLAAALIPTLIKTSSHARMNAIKSVVMLPGIDDKGCIDMAWLDKLNLPGELGSSEGMEFYGKLSILKGVYLNADAIAFPNGLVKSKIESSRGQDIGMEGVLFDRIDALHQIRVGSKAVNPEKDCALEAAFSASDISGKNKCKAALAQKLRIKKDRPLVAFVGRLDANSGIDLVNDILDDLMDRQASLVIAGSGNDAYNNAIDGWKNEFKGCVSWIKDLASCDDLKKLLSAADILLLPSKSENLCRLHQIAMKYGCVVVARNQGCIAADIHAVSNIDAISDEDNGFAFDDYDSDQFFDAVMDALDVYATPAWNDLRAHAMNASVSLADSANDCLNIYSALKV